ncbi:hypothetical protein NYE48_16810 [Paenibacillus sp. FSL M7-1455]|jgi:hypothetical protein|uniref:hypothetical protein n=1 Tax=Paenibacillus TaxID=44249 RepID=UPI002040B9FC|nr:hypothetical protein [Paenibacillus lactis]MCM3494633.1 hypothetical protein [Paenibacillus lactis]
MSKNFVQRIVLSAWVRLSLATLIAISGMFPVLQTMRVQASSDPVVFYVSVTGGVYSQDGLSWETAYPGTMLQPVINNVPDNSQIWVAKGTYYSTEDIDYEENPSDPRTKTFHLRNGIAVYGGFAGTEDSLAQRDLTNEENATILSGNLGDPDSDADNAYHVFYHSVLDSTAVLDGVTITGGNANGSIPNDTDSGGGMYNKNASLTLTHVTIGGNTALIFGGGIYNEGDEGGSPILTDVVVQNNSSTDNLSVGGGIYNKGGSPMLTHVTIKGNRSATGGGIVMPPEAA